MLSHCAQYPDVNVPVVVANLLVFPEIDPTAIALVPLPIRGAFDVKVVAPVPPLPTGSVPVTPVVKGNPVKFVAAPLVGVPNAPL